MLSEDKYYLKIGKAPDLKSPKERRIYRVFEIIPGILAWGTILGVIFFSWFQPVWIAFFIIIFDVYWVLKTIYLSAHLRASYRQMKKNMNIDWMSKVKKQKNWGNIYHLLILPFYEEPFEVIEKTLQALIDSDYSKDKMIVVLGAEERAGKLAQENIEKAERKFGQSFYKFMTTTHPEGILGEMAGKGANSTWMIRQAKEKIIDPLRISYKDIIVSCGDIDTRVYPKYFSCLTYHYLTVKNPTRAGYQPVPVFNNNIWQTSCFSRVVATSGTFWQMIQQMRPERLSSFSSQALSFKTLVDVDFWPVNMVSEDSRIFWQNLLYYDGDYRAIPLYYPVSMDANLAPTFLKTSINVYKQQRRWGWGVENIPFLLFGFLKNKKISKRVKWHWTWVQLEGFWSWATNALLIFMLGWLPLYLGGDWFNTTLLSYNLPRITRTLMTIAMVGLIGSAIYSTLLLPKRPKGQSLVKYFGMVVQWILIPFTILVFGALPGLEAQTRLLLGKYMGFWVTPKKE
ncbi:glycosyltransferase family 2 protein [Patescibacteria group bacterium]|nr:glycosyltransferase family 2 protein [Patescibacteria group bacterium]